MPRALLQRDAELAALTRRFGQASAGTGQLVVVEGPAGIGKSSLLAAASRAADRTGLRVLRSWCGPLEQDAGWGVARQLLGELRSSPEWAEVAVGAAALAGRAIDPDGGEPALGGDAAHAAVRGLTWLVGNLAERSPLLLVVDDVHWADAPSLRWLVQVGRQAGELPLVLLCAVRSGEPPAEPELLAELLAGATEPPVRPAPLGPAAVDALVRERLPDAGDAFSHACHAATAGNPFLLRALLEQVAADGLEPTDETAQRLGSFGTDQVRRTVQRQLARLPADATALALAVAVLGRTVPLRRSGRLAELPPDRAARAADLLAGAGLLGHLDGGYSFTHPLVAGALHAGIPPGTRALMHGAAARLLAGEGADPEEVALHLLHSEPAGDPGTVRRLRSAARQAGARGAPETAAALLQRALAEPAPRTELAELTMELALARAAQLDPGAPALLHRAVGAAGCAEQRSALALSGSRALGLAGHFADAIEVCRQGLGDGSGLPAGLAFRLEAELVGNAWLLSETLPEARERTRRALQSPAPSPLWLVNAAWMAMLDGRPVRQTGELVTAALADGVLAAETGSILSTVLKYTAIAAEDLGTAERLCDELIDLSRPRGWLIALAHGSFMRAIARMQAGRIRDAEADARLSFDHKLGSSPLPALLWSVIPLVDALTELDETAEADAVLAAVGPVEPPALSGMIGGLLLQSRGRLRLAQQRPEDARNDLLAAGERWADLGVRHPGIASWRVDVSAAHALLGDTAEAAGQAQRHLDLATEAGLTAARAAGLRAVASVCRGPEAVGLLEEAVALTAGTTAGLEHTRAQVGLGAALRRANRRSQAQTRLREALPLAEEGGMLRLATRARQELLATGARPRRSALHGPESLTPAEYRVAALAATGLGNPEIAQQLYVTRRTVETHLTHAFAKLGITARTDLAPHFPSAATA